MVPIDCIPFDQEGRLLLLPGHIDLALYSVPLGIAHMMSQTMPTLQNIPGALDDQAWINEIVNPVATVFVPELERHGMISAPRNHIVFMPDVGQFLALAEDLGTSVFDLTDTQLAGMNLADYRPRMTILVRALDTLIEQIDNA